jgi:hypothetical protein
MMTMSGCPGDLDERTELYCLHRLNADQTKIFEEHLAVCPACFYEVLDADLFLESLILALKETDAAAFAHCRKMYT